MSNRAIELHDSRIIAIREEEGGVRVELDAYVHESDGRPGTNAGAGSTQRTAFVFEGARISVRPEGDRLWLTDGGLLIADRLFENMIPLPFDAPGEVVFVACGREGQLEVTGGSFRVSPSPNPFTSKRSCGKHSSGIFKTGIARLSR